MVVAYVILHHLFHSLKRERERVNELCRCTNTLLLRKISSLHLRKIIQNHNLILPQQSYSRGKYSVKMTKSQKVKKNRTCTCGVGAGGAIHSDTPSVNSASSLRSMCEGRFPVSAQQKSPHQMAFLLISIAYSALYTPFKKSEINILCLKRKARGIEQIKFLYLIKITVLQNLFYLSIFH